MTPNCAHLDGIRVLQTTKHYCEDCGKLGQP
jgi:hypothetical protein